MKTSKRRVVRAAQSGVVCGAVLWIMWIMAGCRGSHPPSVGDSPPDFALPTLDGRRVSPKDHRDHIVIVNFWATWCPPCVEEAPSLEKFATEMRRQGVSVIGVSVDEDEAALGQFVAGHHLSFPIARDPRQAVAARYGTFKFPESYILDRHGRIAEKIVGAINWEDPRLIDYVHELARKGHPEK